MKDILVYGAVALGAAAFTWAVMLENHCKQMREVEEYIKVTDELLWMLEETDEYHGIDWGDTVCESDVWCDFCDAREALGLNYLEHYSKVK
jgi:hypothetical protein